MRNKKNNISDETIDAVARQIHSFIAYSSIAMYHAVIKLVDPSTTPEEKDKAEDIINRMMVTAESLYDDLTDKQKELTRGLALDLIKISRRS